MKKTLGLMAMVAALAGVVAPAAMARDRDDHFDRDRAVVSYRNDRRGDHDRWDRRDVRNSYAAYGSYDPYCNR